MFNFIFDYLMLLNAFIHGYDVSIYIWNTFSLFIPYIKMFFVLSSFSLFAMMAIAGILHDLEVE